MPAREDIQNRVVRELQSASPKVLEAGGGKRSYFLVPGAHVTVIDVDEGGLALNTTAHKKILGNLESYDYGDRHRALGCPGARETAGSRPEAALGSSRPGGLIVITGPVSTSMKGLVTKFLPHSVHVAYYRHVMGNPKAGLPGYAPFKTEFASDAGDASLAALLTTSGLKMVAWERFQSAQVGMLRSKSRVLYLGYLFASYGVRALTLGRYGGLDTDFWMLARRGSEAG